MRSPPRKGIGKGIGLALAKEGAKVAFNYFDWEESLVELKQDVVKTGQDHLLIKTDLLESEKIPELVKKVVDRFGRIDILINAAGVAQTGLFLDLTEQQWNHVVDTNLKGTTFCVQAVGRQMIRQVPEEVIATGHADRSYGKIVNFSSISGRHGRATQVPYAASKAAIISVTQSAALAFAPYNINVNAVCPGVIPTPMWEQIDQDRGRISGLAPGESIKSFIERIPLKRAGSVEDVAGVVAFLCSADSDYMTGQTLNVDGGFEMT